MQRCEYGSLWFYIRRNTICLCQQCTSKEIVLYCMKPEVNEEDGNLQHVWNQLVEFMCENLLRRVQMCWVRSITTHKLFLTLNILLNIDNNSEDERKLIEYIWKFIIRAWRYLNENLKGDYPIEFYVFKPQIVHFHWECKKENCWKIVRKYILRKTVFSWMKMCDSYILNQTMEHNPFAICRHILRIDVLISWMFIQNPCKTNNGIEVPKIESQCVEMA